MREVTVQGVSHPVQGVGRVEQGLIAKVTFFKEKLLTTCPYLDMFPHVIPMEQFRSRQKTANKENET